MEKPTMISTFFQPNMVTRLPSNFDERQWVRQIRQTLDEELEEDTEIPVTIFGVPKILLLSNPDCYIPQQVAIGPYHHLRLELYDMERYKVAAAKRNQKELQTGKIQDFVDHLMKHELRIRPNYHRPLNYGGEALAWMMAVDASFLFEFFQVCGVKHLTDRVLTKVPSRVGHLISLARNKTAHNAILRDIIMLENQIPLFVMRMLLEFQHSSLEMADQALLDMLIGISKELSPFPRVKCSRKIEVKEIHHLLDFLYHFIVPKVEVQCELSHIHEEEGEEKKGGQKKEDSCLGRIWYHLEKIKSIILRLKELMKLPWTIISKIPIINKLKEPIENMFNVLDKVKKDDEESNSSNNNEKTPLQEEIAIPSVTQLLEAGVKFFPTKEGITSINFNHKTLAFSMPVIEFDVNTEVVLRNLVAYEAGNSGPLVLARYTDLMNGVIDTDLDAKLLRERGIIVNHLKSEKEVADLWNGMSKSIRLTKVPSLDNVIKDVNKYYNARWKVKCAKFMKEYVFASWRILTFLGAILLLLLMGLQAFCQVYNCNRVFPIKGLEPKNV